MASDAMRVDVAVLGGGAAGLMAGIAAAESGASVVVLEKNRKAGVKILMSGGTRCNITNARGLHEYELDLVSGGVDPAYDINSGLGARSIQQAFGAAGRFLGPSLRAHGAAETIRLIEDEGVPTKVEANGKVFPVSNRALDVQRALLGRLERVGTRLITRAPVVELSQHDECGRFRVATGPESGLVFDATGVILATGGRSYPGCGTTGDGYDLARRLGHNVLPTRPSLVPLRVEAGWVAELAGLTLESARIEVVAPESDKPLAERIESVLFTHVGLSGPAILDVSRAIEGPNSGPNSGPEASRLPDLRIDALPRIARGHWDAELQSACRSGRRAVGGILSERLPKRLASTLMALADVPPSRLGPDLSRAERLRLVEAIKALRVPVASTLGFAKAEVTAGGIPLDEVDPKTLESRVRPGLYIIGEVLDLDGWIGGYNFQAAWSTGWLAGQTAAARALDLRAQPDATSQRSIAIS